MKKRIICCSDGTWNKPGLRDKGRDVFSNVQLMFKSICRDGNGIRQVKMYESGVGSSYTLTDKFGGGITGQGLDKKIKDVYSFLVMNYVQGDDIYLFGFSRGAYTARSVAGFIRNCGILKPENIHLLDKAFEYYRDRNAYTAPDSDLMVSFRSNYCVEDITKIKFIGVWDTVGSLGIPLPFYKKFNMEKYKFHDVTLSSTVEHAYHALAINEHRAPFRPSLWELSKTAIDNPGLQKMEQRWFTGVHCNIGGGYLDTGLSDIALNWLMDMARQIDNNDGLVFDTAQLHPVKINANPAGPVRNSFTLQYWLTGYVWRKVKQGTHTNETIDESVLTRIKAENNFRPRNMKHLNLW